jgi:hypothetical protein
MMNQIKARTQPPFVIRSREMANDVLLQQVARMEPNPAAVEYKDTLIMAS